MRNGEVIFLINIIIHTQCKDQNSFFLLLHKLKSLIWQWDRENYTISRPFDKNSKTKQNFGHGVKKNASLFRRIQRDIFSSGPICTSYSCEFFLAKAKSMVPVKALSFVIHTLGRNAQDFVVTRSELSIV